MKYWKVKQGTKVHDWCVSFGNEYQITNEKRIALCKSVIPGRKKIVPIVNGDSLVGMRYLHGELPETIPDPRLVISKHKTVEGKTYYVPHKKNKASKELWQAMERLRQKSTAPLCGMLGITPVTFDSGGLRFNNPGLLYVSGTATFYLKTGEDFQGCNQVERITDVEYESLPK